MPPVQQSVNFSKHVTKYSNMCARNILVSLRCVWLTHLGCIRHYERLDFLKVVRLVFWSGVVGPGTNEAFARSRFALARSRSRSALVRSRFALTVALRAQKLDLWASLIYPELLLLKIMFWNRFYDVTKAKEIEYICCSYDLCTLLFATE